MLIPRAWPPEYPNLITDRVIMRPPESKDYMEWATIRDKNKIHLKPFEPKWPKDALTEDFFKKRLKRQQREWENGRGYSFLICDRTLGEIIGGMNINNVSRGAAQFASLGYWMDIDHQSQGLMGEAMELTLHFCFSYIRLERINAATLLHNEPSQKLLLRAGFAEEGYAKSYIQINGFRQDHKLFGLNKDDYLGNVKT